MSYVLTPYLVDLKDIKKVVGSRDTAAGNAIKGKCSELFGEQEDGQGVTVAQAVQHLVMGEQPQRDYAHQYGYALEAICAYHGSPLLPDLWGGAHWETVEACGLEPLLTKTSAPIKLPPNKDFPTIGHMSRNQIDKYLKSARNQREEDDRDLSGLLDEYIGWLETAKKKNKDIVFFYR